MPSSLELKFLVDDLAPFKERLVGLGMTDRLMHQDDTYFYSRNRYVKLRSTDGGAPSLITYQRPIMPGSRVSEYDRIDVTAQPGLLEALDYLSPVAIVRKTRHQFALSGAALNFDEVEGVGPILEIEVDETGDVRRDQAVFDQWVACLGLKPSQACPYSNAHLINIFNRAQSLPALSGSTRRNVCFLDGSSGSGKSTVKSSILRTYRKTVGYVVRETTRSPRPDDLEHSDYRFVSGEQFFARALSGSYIECRDYLFGMSYGLPWSDLAEVTHEGQVALALVNLGSGHFLKKLIPNSLTILLYAEPEVIRERLTARQGLRENQIEERVENATQALSYADDYDLALDTGAMSVTDVITNITHALGGTFY